MKIYNTVTEALKVIQSLQELINKYKQFIPVPVTAFSTFLIF